MFGWKKKEKVTPQKAEGGASTEVVEKDTAELKVKVLERKGCSATLAVTVKAEEVSLAVEDAFKEVQRQAKLPGFRPGKAPMEMIRRDFHGHALEHGINNLIKETVEQALEQEKIIPLAVPSVDKVDYHDGKPLKYEMKVECTPEVVLKDYRGLPIVKKIQPLTDAEVEERLNSLRENNAKLVPSAEEVVSEKSFAVVDYDATLEGKTIEGGKAQDQLIEVSAPQSMAGFNDGLKGMKKGETKDVPIKFPDDHPNKDLAGKTALFKVTVKDVKEKKLPAVDDEFAKDLGMESLEKLRTALRTNMEAERSRQEHDDLEKQVIDALLERHPFEVPASQVESRAHDLTERLKKYVLSQGASAADWAKNEPTMVDKNRVEAERQVRLSYLLLEIAEKEGIEGTDADVDEAIAKAVKDALPEKAADAKKWFEQRRQAMKGQLKEEKIFKFLIDHAKVTEQATNTIK